MNRGETFEVTIDELAAGGDGVGRVETEEGAFVVFVDGGVPGDRLAVRLEEKKKRFGRASLQTVLQPGPGRIEPRCVHAVRDGCGGCGWLHVSTEVQAQAKQQIALRALRKVIDETTEVRPILQPCKPSGWRRRARLAFEVRANGHVVLGLHAHRSHRLVDLSSCAQLDPALDAALPMLRKMLAAIPRSSGELAMVVGRGGDLQVDLDTGPNGPVPLRAELERIVGRSGIVGISCRKGVVGEAAVELEPGLSCGARDFAQASHAGNAALIACVEELAGSRAGLRVLELYAGGGNFTRRLAVGAAALTATDVFVPAQRAELDKVEWLTGDSAEVLAKLAGRGGEPFALAVLDPPRSGAPGMLPLVLGLGAKRVIYVSCDPATLARDLESVADDLRIETVQPLDLMPHTPHVEVVVAATRRAA